MRRQINAIGCVCVFTLVNAALAQAQCPIGWSYVEPPVLEPRDYYVSDLMLFDDGTGAALFAAGTFRDQVSGVAHIAKWEGNRWTTLDGGASNTVRTISSFDDGSGPALFVFGDFSYVGPTVQPILTRNGAKWTASGWQRFNLDFQGSSWLRNSFVLDDGGGLALYLVGGFESINGATVNSLAKWDGLTWQDVGGGVTLDGKSGYVAGLAIFDDGTGPALYAGGSFDRAGFTPASNVAKWDGKNWSPVGDGVSGGTRIPHAQALIVYDDGNGPALYCGGSFTSPGRRLAKWDGTKWTSVGAIQPIPNDPSTYVADMLVFSSGAGPELYVSGSFAGVDELKSPNVARWDGRRWRDVGGGTSHEQGSHVAVVRVQVPTPTGPTLLISGAFNSAGGVPVVNIARWGCVPGDLNCDAVLDALDIEPFILALTDPQAYSIAYPDCNRDLADMNADGAVDAFDIEGFTRALQ
jgi:hypothetical protein